jgi:uncharacterized protein YecE (DUF72 family)
MENSTGRNEQVDGIEKSPARKTGQDTKLISWNIGTSGYVYGSWRKCFYPEEVPQRLWLEYYCAQFNTLELNSSFYRFPREKYLKEYYRRTPADFKFAVKAHKIITHSKRFYDAFDKVTEFTDVVFESLREKLACILFQLPPGYAYTKENHEKILDAISGNPYNIIECRHLSWFKKPIVNTFVSHGISFCNISHPALPQEIYPGSPVFYFRFHGIPELYKSFYSLDSLKEFYINTASVSPERFIYFNNTYYEAGFTNADMLKRIIAKHG